LRWRMVRSITLTPPSRGGWMSCGALISGWTARLWAATKKAASGTNAMMSIANWRRWELDPHAVPLPPNLLRHFGAALCGKRGGDHSLVHHAGDGDAGRDADAGPGLARRRGLLSRHVGGNDGGDDAALAGAGAVALSPGIVRRKPGTRDAAHGAGGRRLLLCLAAARNCPISARSGPHQSRDAVA